METIERTPAIDAEFVHDDGRIRRAVSWSASLQCWAWRCWDLETGALLGSGTAKGARPCRGCRGLVCGPRGPGSRKAPQAS